MQVEERTSVEFQFPFSEHFHKLLGKEGKRMYISGFTLLVNLITRLSNDPPLSTTSTGPITGLWSTSYNGKVFASYLGVPYGKPPVGKLRLLRPQPAEPWAGTKQCVKDVKCFQRNPFWKGHPQEGQEDCLVLNVHRPTTTETSPLPVMVFLHGGAFVAGSGTSDVYGAQLLMDRDVILVTINFRVSVLGNLFIDEDISGNQGTWDQNLALKWVQANIGYFGGDKTRVTLFGESSGAMGVMNHILSPHSKGLFSAAIVQSGCLLGPMTATGKHPAYYGHQTARKLGCYPAPSNESTLDCLQRLSPLEIQYQEYLFEEFMYSPMPFKPIVDGGLVPDPFLPGEPKDLFLSGQFNHVPIIIGTNREEGLVNKAFYMINASAFEVAYANWRTIGPLAMFNKDRDLVTDVEASVAIQYLHRHFGDAKFGPEGLGARSLVTMYGDAWFTVPCFLTARMISNTSSQPVYQYLYSYRGTFSGYDLMVFPTWKIVLKVLGAFLGVDVLSSEAGVSHGDELLMMLVMNVIPAWTVSTRADREVSGRILDMWTSFASTRNPTPDGLWQKLEAETYKFLDIEADKCSMKYPKEFKERVEEWETMWEKVPPYMSHVIRKNVTQAIV